MEEQFDLCDAEGKLIGEQVARSKAHREALWHKTAHIWIYNSHKELLLQKRADNKESFPSYWDISAAGHIPAGEEVLDAAIRECEEEIGVQFSADQFELIGFRQQRYNFPEKNFFDREYVTIYLIRTNLPLSAYKAQEEEVSELRFISTEELRKALKEKATWLVPHWDEYEKVLSYLNS